MADQKIWSNETGQVLLGAGGMVLRQPFNFEKGFYQGLNTSMYLRVQNRMGINPNNHTVSIWSNRYGLAVPTSLIIAYPSDGTNKFFITSGGTSGYFYIENGSLLGGGTWVMDMTHLWAAKSADKVEAGVSKLSSSMSIGAQKNIDYFYIGGGVAGAAKEKTLSNFRVFNRPCSASEMQFIYANGVGASPLTKQGLVIDVPMREAEILDFSLVQDGSDMRVGCRDFSGNIHHAEFIGLPAGTLTEKKDWANSNLFRLFL